jgi:DNA polymerase I
VSALRALDLYCCAGGAARGLQQAGFHVTGVDLHPQPNYCGDRFIQTDALEYLETADLSQFDFIWASPPCQAHTILRHAPGTKEHIDLVTPTRPLLVRSGKPYCIENVPGAPLIDPVTLCGSMFGLTTPDGKFGLKRHRLFETNFPLAAPSPCWCRHLPTVGVYGGHFRNRQRDAGTNHRSGSNIPLEDGFAAMGIDWRMTTAEISEAIPPAYSKFIAEAFLHSTGRSYPPPTSPEFRQGGAGNGQDLSRKHGKKHEKHVQTPIVDEPAPARAPALDALAGVTVVYCAEEPQARRLLTEMVVEVGWLAIDIETAPNKTAVDRLAGLLQTKAEMAGQLKAARKLKAPPAEIATHAAAIKRLATEIRYAQTAGLDPHRARIRLLQVYAGGDRVLVIDLDRTGAGVFHLLDGAYVIAHNIAFELAFLEAEGVALGGMQCTLQAVRLSLGEHATSLAAAARAYLNVDLDKTLQASDWNAPSLTQAQIDYAAIDAVVAWRIAMKILPRFDIQKSAYEIQIGAVPAAVRMERRGFKLDIEAHAKLIADLGEERLAAAREYCEACVASGHMALADKAPSTPAQKEGLLKALLSSDELKHWRRTEKSGALSTKRSELMRAGHYPPILALAKLSRIDKMLSSFGMTLAALVSPVTGRIHAHYRIASTASGRASCAGPNLQQIPRDPRFRALFVPEPGNAFVIADYSSMELRAAAYISSDHAMTQAFEQGLDLHRLTASQMTGKDPAEVTVDERKGAKCVNFGSVYGQGAGGLVQTAWDQFDIVLDFDEAKAWLKAFEDANWGFVRWRRVHYRHCEGRRYIVIGRDMARGIGRIYPESRVPEGGSFYTRCCNLPIQGACADAAMLALAYVDGRLFEAGIDGGPVAWLHDEIVLEVRDDLADLAAEILKQAMIDGFIETFPDAPIDGLVKPHIAASWAEKS